MRRTGQAKAYTVTAIEAVKPCPYMAHGAVPLFPPHTDPHRLLEGGKLYLNGHNDFTSSLQPGYMFSPYYDDTWYALYDKAQQS